MATLFSRRDRREMGVLGLVVLAWGLAAAPLVHLLSQHAAVLSTRRVGHSLPLRPAGHSHGAPRGESTHGEGSLEHFKAVFSSGVATPVLLLVLVAVCAEEPIAPAAPVLAARPRVEQPQGP